eukprot:COSAG02_NODE_2176_length_9589_cov_4.787671_8_plen_56_part_00
MAREPGEGEVLVATGAEIALTMPLRVCEKAGDWDRKNRHCEWRPSGPRAAVGGWG